MQGLHRLWGLAVMAALVSACSGSGNSGDPRGTAPPPTGTADSGCTGACANANSFLSVADVQKVIAQAVAEAQAQNQPATVAVVDRVGNVLGVYRMSGARTTVRISSGRGVVGGLEGIAIIPSELAAISKAVTGAYLSSEGNAFSTRTASQIVQEHFNPGEFGGPSGPLFGVQFSNLLCSDVFLPPFDEVGIQYTPNLPEGVGLEGPRSSPLGLSADPGGFPLYKSGTPVGGVGVVADGTYGLDPNVADHDRDVDELIATAASFGFGAPLDRRADRITADGKTLRFSDVGIADLARNPDQAPAFSSLTESVGTPVDVLGYFFDHPIRPGTAFGTDSSGIRPDTTNYPGLDAFVLSDSSRSDRFAPRDGVEDNGLSANEARELVRAGLAVANRSRAQIRRPTGSQARVTVTVVDTGGNILALARTRDAPVFGTDVAVQKARSAAFFSGNYVETEFAALPDAVYANADGSASSVHVDFGQVIDQSQQFFAEPNLFSSGNGSRSGPFAMTPRALGNISRPYFPDGIVGANNGPFSKPFASWSPFTDGLQFDLINNQLLGIVSAYLAEDWGAIYSAGVEGCTGNARLKNGIQIFPGGVPIYRGADLVGAIGVSGDGVDQDDMIAALGLKNAAATLNTGIGHAPANMRADRLQPQGVRLRYVQCPQSPFLDSTEQNVCEGL